MYTYTHACAYIGLHVKIHIYFTTSQTSTRYVWEERQTNTLGYNLQRLKRLECIVNHPKMLSIMSENKCMFTL